MATSTIKGNKYIAEDFSHGYLRRRNGIVTMNITANLPAASDGGTLFTIPEEYRPVSNVDYPIFNAAGGGYLGTLRIQPSGVCIAAFGAMKTGSSRVAITYVTNK